jgi:hypothetical protein
VEDAWLKAMAVQCPQLKKLVAKYCHQVTPAALNGTGCKITLQLTTITVKRP